MSVEQIRTGIAEAISTAEQAAALLDGARGEVDAVAGQVGSHIGGAGDLAGAQTIERLRAAAEEAREVIALIDEGAGFARAYLGSL